jgi:hypothetical protein
VDFATTRIPITIFFVAYRGASLRAANVRGLFFLRELLQLYDLTFLGTIVP